MAQTNTLSEAEITIAMTCGWVATCTASALTIPDIYLSHTNLIDFNTGFSYYPKLLLAVNCFLWMIYGIILSLPQVWIANFLAMITTIYLMFRIFYFRSKNKHPHHGQIQLPDVVDVKNAGDIISPGTSTPPA